MKLKFRAFASVLAMLCLSLTFISVYAVPNASISAEVKAEDDGVYEINVRLSEGVEIRSGSAVVDLSKDVELTSAEWKVENPLISDYSISNGKGVFTFSSDRETVGTILSLKVKLGENAEYGEKNVNIVLTFRSSDGSSFEVSCVAKINVECEHEWGSGSEVRAASCTENGLKEYACTVCGEKKTEETDMIAHTAGEWEAESAAEVGKAGKMVKKCTQCGLTLEEKEIPLESGSGSASGGDGSGNNGGNSSYPSGGCGSSLTAALGSAFLGLAAAFELFVKHRML